MAKKGVNISLKGYDEIFTTEETRTNEKLEKVQNISLSELHPFKNHPFKVIDDESMLRTVESVAQYGFFTDCYYAYPVGGSDFSYQESKAYDYGA